MIPAIGLMIGAYIITRMIELGANPTTPTGVKVVATLTLIVTALCTVFLLFSGAGT